MAGSGPTLKCKQCFARIHSDCLKLHNENNPIEMSQSDMGTFLCPVCIGNASEQILATYNNLEASIEEEKNLLRDWSEKECLACGDVGSLICCDLCFYEHPLNINQHEDSYYNKTKSLFITGHLSKLDSAGQFHLKCAMTSNTNPFICPLCTTEFGSNRLQSLHFFNVKRRKEREFRMQQKALKAQEFVKEIGFEIDEIKKCVCVIHLHNCFHFVQYFYETP